MSAPGQLWRGYLPHRFDGSAFDNPSIYCDALYALSDRMVQVLRADLPPHLWTAAKTHTSEVPER